ncbi:MAG: TPM domain-containing protein [Acidobacteriota bacterium]
MPRRRRSTGPQKTSPISRGSSPPERAPTWSEKLAAFERATSTQVLVYTAARVPGGTTMEELASRALRDWGVGQKGRSNGVIFFVFPTDRSSSFGSSSDSSPSSSSSDSSGRGGDSGGGGSSDTR